MTVRWLDYVGHANECLRALRITVGQLARRSERIKIGLTIDPYRRWVEHSRDALWEELVVIYSTTSRKYCGSAESALIQHCIARHGPKMWNERDGGGGLRYDAQRYYIYVLRG